MLWTEWLANRHVTVKNSPLWKTNPKQQMGYLQARNWARLYAPGALLGVYTTDELETVNQETGAVTTRRGIPASTATVERVDAACKNALPACLQEDLERDLPKMQKIIDSEKRTAVELLATMSTKAIFTEAQRVQILALKKTATAVSAPAPAAPLDDDFVRDMDASEVGAK